MKCHRKGHDEAFKDLIRSGVCCPVCAMAELRAEVERLRACLQRIVDHHEDQRGAWESIEDADNRDYHEQRRNVALIALRGEG